MSIIYWLFYRNKKWDQEVDFYEFHTYYALLPIFIVGDIVIGGGALIYFLSQICD